MRRSTKPFTVEVKKRGGGRRRGGGDPGVERLAVVHPSFNEPVGRDIRFRDAESLFRAIAPVETEFTEPEPAPVAADASSAVDPAPRRILPDLIAEAALSEAAQAASPEPRRRGRPPKDRTEDRPRPIRMRKPVEPDLFEETFVPADVEEVAPSSPAFLYLAASARRRARRVTDNLPRAERWKRRLPKACW